MGQYQLTVPGKGKNNELGQLSSKRPNNTQKKTKQILKAKESGQQMVVTLYINKGKIATCSSKRKEMRNARIIPYLWQEKGEEKIGIPSRKWIFFIIMKMF